MAADRSWPIEIIGSKELKVDKQMEEHCYDCLNLI